MNIIWKYRVLTVHPILFIICEIGCYVPCPLFYLSSMFCSLCLRLHGCQLLGKSYRMVANCWERAIILASRFCRVLLAAHDVYVSFPFALAMVWNSVVSVTDHSLFYLLWKMFTIYGHDCHSWLSLSYPTNANAVLEKKKKKKTLLKSCSFGLPRVPFVNCRQFMYLVISLLVLRAGYGIWLYQFLIIAYLFTSFRNKIIFLLI